MAQALDTSTRKGSGDRAAVGPAIVLNASVLTKAQRLRRHCDLRQPLSLMQPLPVLLCRQRSFALRQAQAGALKEVHRAHRSGRLQPPVFNQLFVAQGLVAP
jgi:hypothetical protein